MSGIVYTILRNEIYRKREKVLRNRLFGYSTAYNKSEGAILSWIAPYGYPQTNQGERLRNAKSVFSMPLPLINPFPRGYMLVSKISETLTLCVSAACRAAVCKRLSDFFVCTSRMSGIVYTIIWIERSEKQKDSAFLQSCSVLSDNNVCYSVWSL